MFALKLVFGFIRSVYLTHTHAQFLLRPQGHPFCNFNINTKLLARQPLPLLGMKLRGWMVLWSLNGGMQTEILQSILATSVLVSPRPIFVLWHSRMTFFSSLSLSTVSVHSGSGPFFFGCFVYPPSKRGGGGVIILIKNVQWKISKKWEFAFSELILNFAKIYPILFIAGSKILLCAADARVESCEDAQFDRNITKGLHSFLLKIFN